MQYTIVKDGNNIDITVTSTFVEWVKGFPFDEKDINYHGHFKIHLSTESGSDSFDFYGSANDAVKQKFIMNNEDLKYVLKCIIDDGLAGFYSFEEFCNEFGYDEDSRRAEKIYKACEDTCNQLSVIGIGEEEMCVIVNDLNEV